jgi:hypothetical protein
MPKPKGAAIQWSDEDTDDTSGLLLLMPLALAMWKRHAGRQSKPDEATLIRVLSGIKTEMRTATGLMNLGKISLPEWQNRMRQYVDAIYLIGVAIAAGTWDVTEAQVEVHKDERKKQLAFLLLFANDIQSGVQKPNGSIIARIGLYASAGWAVLQGIKAAVAGKRYTEERRVLSPAHHCEDCPPLAALGWQPIGTLPPIGDSECGANCKCRFEYR